MYPNYRSVGRGTEQNFSENSSGSRSANVTLTTSSVTPQLQEQKYSAAGSSSFVPSLNAITSNQDLQWLVQPSLLPTAGPSRPIHQPYPLPPRISSMNPLPAPQPHFLRPGVIRPPTGPGGSTRRRNDEQLSQEELERRRIRRERNKLAAAKCRNRRRELTDTLQSETDLLEDEKSRLQKEIADLQKEKEKLELVLEAHRPICKVQDSDSDSDSSAILPSLSGIKIEPVDSELAGPSRECKSSTKQEKPKQEKPRPKITIPPPPSVSAANVNLESDSLNTPILISTPSLTPFTASMVFTYPTTSLEASASTSTQTFSHPSVSFSHHGTSHHVQNPEPCGIAHRRSSSSGDQSDQSLNSPTILTL